MTDDGGRTSRYKIIAGSDGNRYQFFCEVSGALVCTTESIILQTPEKELRFAWESEGKKNFNRCHRCGKWVSDVVYNADTFECVECSPWEEIPAYCPHCGAKTVDENTLCPQCGCRLRYGKENTPDEMKQTMV